MDCDNCNFSGDPRYFQKDREGINFCVGCWLD